MVIFDSYVKLPEGILYSWLTQQIVWSKAPLGISPRSSTAYASLSAVTKAATAPPSAYLGPRDGD